MRQHQDPDDFHHEDLHRYDDQDDEFGRPVYQGTGLTVRELNAEELQRSWTPTKASPPSCWAAAGTPSTHQPIPSRVPGPLRPRRCQ
jgi:hypothetical protein